MIENLSNIDPLFIILIVSLALNGALAWKAFGTIPPVVLDVLRPILEATASKTTTQFDDRLVKELLDKLQTPDTVTYDVTTASASDDPLAR